MTWLLWWIICFEKYAAAFPLHLLKIWLYLKAWWLNGQNQQKGQTGGQFVHHRPISLGTKKEIFLLPHYYHCSLGKRFLKYRNIESKPWNNPCSMPFLVSSPRWYHCQASGVYTPVPSHVITSIYIYLYWLFNTKGIIFYYLNLQKYDWKVFHVI